MRTIERILVLAVLLAITSTVGLAGQSSLLRVFVVIVAASLVPLHAWAEGLHWQMLPACLAALLLPLGLTTALQNPTACYEIATSASILLLTSLVACWALPMFKLPQPSGRYPVGTRMLYLTDPSRSEMHVDALPGNREVVVQLWYPSAIAKGTRAKYRRWRECSLLSSYQAVLKTDSLQDAPLAPGRFPIIIYNPGWHGFRHKCTFMTQELASHGFVVAAVSHPSNTSIVELSQGQLACSDQRLDVGFSGSHYIPLHERLELAEWELAIQVDDCQFLLDELSRFEQTPDHPLASHLFVNRVGAYGHSFGGAVSAQFAKGDERVQSVLALDGVLHGSVAEHGLEKPFMLIDSTWILSVSGHEDAVQPHRGKETTQLWKKIADAKADTLKRHGGIRVVIGETTHSSFTDSGFMSPLRRLAEVGPLPQSRLAHILNTHAIEFFRKTLLDEPAPLLSESISVFPEANLEVWPAAMQSQLIYDGLNRAHEGRL